MINIIKKGIINSIITVANDYEMVSIKMSRNLCE